MGSVNYLAQVTRSYRRNTLTEAIAGPGGSRHAVIAAALLVLHRLRGQQFLLLVVERREILLRSHFQGLFLATGCAPIGDRQVGQHAGQIR